MVESVKPPGTLEPCHLADTVYNVISRCRSLQLKNDSLFEVLSFFQTNFHCKQSSLEPQQHFVFRSRGTPHDQLRPKRYRCH